MGYQELTPMDRSRYDGYMDPSAESSQSQSAQESSGVRPAPVDEAQQSLLANMNSEKREGDVSPVDSMQRLIEDPESKKLINRERTTKNYLAELSRNVLHAQTAGEILQSAEQINYAAKMIQKHKQNLSQADIDKLNPDSVAARMEQILDAIRNNRLEAGLPPEAVAAARAQQKQRVSAYAPELSRIAAALQDYFIKEKIAPQERDPYKPITSFEELMSKWVDVADVGFRSGEKFALIDVEEQTDEFGRTILKETAHPDNFLRWVQEKSWFYHDFDPYDEINLFQKLYLTVGFRTVSVYEMIVDVPTYFYHRGTTIDRWNFREDPLTSDQLEKAAKPQKDRKDPQKMNEPTFHWENGQEINEQQARAGDVVGSYDILDPSTGEKKRYTVTVMGVIQGQVYYEAKDAEGNPPVVEVADKDQWRSEELPSFEAIKGQMLYQVWLLMKSHNHDFHYRFEGMPTETELKKVMAAVYGDNLLTQDRKRLLGLLTMPSMSNREEMDRFMEGKLEGKQGSLGKAMQRSLAALYHLSESSGTANGYGGLDKFNPFVEVLRKEGTEGADIFYKSLIRQTIEEKFPAAISDVARDLAEVMDGAPKDPKGLRRVRLSDHPMLLEERSWKFGRQDANGNTIPAMEQQEWERADVLDMMILGKNDLADALQKRGFKPGALNVSLQILRKYYQEEQASAQEGKPGDAKRAEMQKKLHDLDAFEQSLQRSTKDRKNSFFKQKDPKNPEKQLFENKDGYMDAKKKDKEGRDIPDPRKSFLDLDGMEGLDYFAVKFFAAQFGKFGASDTNIYGSINYDPRARKMVKQALRDTIQQTEKLDNFEAKYAEEFAFVLSYHTGISARNDMQGIGHDAWSKIINTEFYRLRQSGGGNYPGNLDNLYGLHRLGVNFWEGMKVQVDGASDYDKTLYEILVGFDEATGTFDLSKNIAGFDFHGNAQRQFVADHVGHAIDLFVDITKTQEFNLEKLIKTDNFGRLIWNNEEMQKMVDNTWKHLRYAFDNRQFLYDNKTYTWLYDENIKANGQVTRTPHFGLMTLREAMFSKKVRDMNMYERQDVSSWSGAENYHTKMARNIFAFLIAGQLREHTRYSGGYRIYSADEVEMITQAFLQYAARIMQGENGEAIVMSGFFNAEEMMKILVTAHAMLWYLRMRELGVGVGGGFLGGLFDALVMIMKQAGAGIKL